jgi:hypothetical protein
MRATCAHCGDAVDLLPNPKIVGTVVDETGAITEGRMAWSAPAWAELLGGDEADEAVTLGGLASGGEEMLRDVQEKMSFSRVMLLFGWAPETRRLVVLGVREGW